MTAAGREHDNARIAYQAWRASVSHWRELPTWIDLPADVQGAWVAAVVATDEVRRDA